MPGISTEYLANQIVETNRRFDAERERVDGENRRLTDAIRHLDHSVTELNGSMKFLKWIGTGLYSVGLLVFGFTIEELRRNTRIESAVETVKENASGLKEQMGKAQTAYQTRDEQFSKMMEAIVRLEHTLARPAPAPK